MTKNKAIVMLTIFAVCSIVFYWFEAANLKMNIENEFSIPDHKQFECGKFFIRLLETWRCFDRANVHLTEATNNYEFFAAFDSRDGKHEIIIRKLLIKPKNSKTNFLLVIDKDLISVKQQSNTTYYKVSNVFLPHEDMEAVITLYNTATKKKYELKYTFKFRRKIYYSYKFFDMLMSV